MSDSLDPNAENRKSDHIHLAFSSRLELNQLDRRFYYEPAFSGHPGEEAIPEMEFLSKKFSIPVWVSSMTGGTKLAGTINKNLAKACKEYGMGMGLGSCRALLYDDAHLEDFRVRKYMGDQALYANLGIAQIEQLSRENKISEIKDLIDKLDADGLIVHINPMQEWLQPEGDRYDHAPIETISRLIDKLDAKIIVKEVGQGMGPKSIQAFLSLPIEAFDFAASGGTNFSLLELSRANEEMRDYYQSLAYVGHDADDMIDSVNWLMAHKESEINCKQIIISGGIRNFLDGYYQIQKCALPSVYGQASAFLKQSMDSYERLQVFMEKQIEGLKIAYSFLRIRN
jgi:isopentenyl-diphosphate Delta-isomerase